MSGLAMPEALDFFSPYVIKLECDFTSLVESGGSGDKAGCCLLDAGRHEHGGYCLFQDLSTGTPTLDTYRMSQSLMTTMQSLVGT